MTKTLLSLLALTLFLSVSGQSCSNSADSKRAPPSGPQAKFPYPHKNNEWYCMFTFYKDSKPYYIEDLYHKQPKAFRTYFSSRADNMIDEFSWEGTRCNCWVVFYQNKNYKGLNFGAWTNTEKGSRDLSNYITYDFKQRSWNVWDSFASSYSIYCY